MSTFERLVEILENYVEADEIKSEDNFKLDLGMTSFDTMCLVGDIKTVFGVELKAIDFLNNKTVGEMAAYIESVCEKN